MQDPDADVPFYLMPVAAVLAMYAMIVGIRCLYIIYSNLTAKKKDDGGIPTTTTTSLTSLTFLGMLVSVAIAVVGYGMVVAHIENAVQKSNYALFDPYEILQVSESANSTVIKQAYRSLSKIHHPDKGGDADVFDRLNTAYRALTDDKKNYELYGHPDGPVQTRTMAFAMPEWMLHPTGNIALVMLLLYLGMFVGLVVYVVRWATKNEQAAALQAKNASVAGEDAQYLASRLLPTSTHMDILYLIATTPENISIMEKQIAKIEEQKAKRKAKKAASTLSSSGSNNAFDIGDSGWDEDNDPEDEDVKRARMEEEQRAKEKKALKEAQGEVKLEGLDEGVLGQQWVESTLAKKGIWPPKKLGILEGCTFKSKKKELSPLEHPAVRRLLCMTTGRINSFVLNTHPDLLEASSKGLIDKTYFAATMEYRQRANLLFEMSLRVAASMKSYRLAKTVVETVAMFKIGVPDGKAKKHVDHFRELMKKQYGDTGIPKMVLNDITMETEGEDEIANGDTATIKMDFVRAHAENMAKVKVMMAQKQGIPPQMALQTYREGWWILLRCKKLDGNKETIIPVPLPSQLPPLLGDVQSEAFEKERGEFKLLLAWPMIVQNAAQQGGKMSAKFKVPEVPGKYKFTLSIMSQEFLGCDQEVDITKQIVDVASVKRIEDEEEDEGEGKEDEPKKDK